MCSRRGAYADRGLPQRGPAGFGGRDDRLRGAARLRDCPARPHARSRHRSARPPARPQARPPVLAALRLGAYQLGFMGSVPEHAAVNESVELVRRAGLERAVAFTNAVMRRLVAGPPARSWLPESTPDEAALKHSYPDWVAETMVARARRDGAARSCAPRTSRRTLPAPSPQGANLDDYPGGRDPDLPEARIVERILDDWLEQGLAAAEPRVAARGPLGRGRTASAASTSALRRRERPRSSWETWWPSERHEGRARELTKTTLRLGAENVRVVCANGLALPPDLDGFDQALVDAPCSGLGTLASRPDLRWRAGAAPRAPAGAAASGHGARPARGARSRTPSAR